MPTQRNLAALGLLCASLIASPAFAQDVAAAKTLFSQGITEMEAGRFDTGCPALETSYKLDPRAGTMFALAECEAKRGRLATAVARYDDYLSLHGRMAPDQQKKQGDRAKVAQEQKAALGPQVPMLTLTLPAGAPRETVVKRDDTQLSGPALGLALPVDPGEHVIRTQAPEGPVTEVRITLSKGEKKVLTLDVKLSADAAAPVAAAPPPAPPVDQGVSSRRMGAYIAGGVGVAGMILGGVMGGLTLGKKGVISDNCNIGGRAEACNDAGLAAASDGKTLGLVSTLGFAVGAAGLGTAVVLFITEPSGPKHAATNPGKQRGIRAEVLSIGPEGARVGVGGAW
jgi:hypothetical protein